mmetsp:Transcript_121626/g.351070  ORF Transcript_121626/g.351070 Transcript_121626/m.351070 type:complete len:303 (-) Transcript_121626:884-1792(-)
MGDNSVMVLVEPPEHIAHKRVLLTHRLPDLLHHRLYGVILELSIGIAEQLGGVLVLVENLELMVVHLDDIAWHEVIGLEKLTCHLIHMHTLLQETPCDDTQIPLWRLVHRQAVVLHVISDDEDAIRVLRLRVRKAGLEAKHLARVVEELLNVFLRRLRDEVRHRGHRIVPRPVARVRRRLRPRYRTLRKLHVHALAQVFAELFPEVLPGELVGIVDKESEVRQQRDLHAHVPIACVDILALLPRLSLRPVNGEGSHGHLRLAEEDGEVVPPTIQWIHLPDLHLVIRQEEEDNKRSPLELRCL